MNKLIFSILFVIFLISLVSAISPVQELFNSVNININIAQNESTSNLYLNTSGTSFDFQNFSYGAITLNNIQISKLLSEINGEVSTGSPVQFKSLNIEQSTLLSSMMDMFLSDQNLDFTTNDINNNISIINNYLKNVNSSSFFANLNKNGNNYNFYVDKGINDIPSDYKARIQEIIDETFYSVNLYKLVNQIMPFLDSSQKELLNGINFNYTVSVDLSNVSLVNGLNNIIVSVTDENTNETFNKTIGVILSDVLETPIVVTPSTTTHHHSRSSTSKVIQEVPKETPKEIPTITYNPPIDTSPNPPAEKDNTLTYLLIGIGVLIILITIVIIQRKFFKNVSKQSEKEVKQ